MADDTTVLIDLQGQLAVIGSAAQRRLAGRPGRYRVVPSPDGLVILERIDGPQPAHRHRSVAISGDIDRSGGLVDIVNFINGNAWSGSLGVLAGNTRKTIYFRRGDVTTAASNVAEDRIGAILYRHGMISAEVLQQALAEVTQEQRVGQVLVQRGHLSPHQLYQYVRRQIEEIFFSALAISHGQYYFHRTGDDEGPASQLLLPARELLFDGVRRIDELAWLRSQLPGPDAMLGRRNVAAGEPLPERVAAVLALVDGKRPQTAIVRDSQLGELEASKILHQLLSEGRIEVRPMTHRPRLPTPVIEEVGHTLDAYNHIYARIQSLVSAHGRPDVLARGLASFFHSMDEFAPLFANVVLAPDGRLPRDQLLANLASAPVAKKHDYLQRGMNELLFFVLFTAGESVDRRKESELHARLSQILREVMAVEATGTV